MASGAVGSPTYVEVLFAIDPNGPRRDIDTTHPGVRSRLEAEVFGLDLTEFLVGSPVVSARQRGTNIIDYSFDGAASATQVQVDAALSSAPGFSLAMVGERGRMLVRAEWAPGDVAVRERGAGRWTAPAVERSKPNLQAADTVRGGWETVALLLETRARRPAEADCARALRLLGQAPCRVKRSTTIT